MDGPQGLSEWRIDDSIDEQKATQENGKHEHIHVDLVAEINEPEQAPTRHALDSILAMDKGRLNRKELHHLRKGERDHREVDALPADGDRGREQPSPAPAALPTRIANSGERPQTEAACAQT